MLAAEGEGVVKGCGEEETSIANTYPPTYLPKP